MRVILDIVLEEEEGLVEEAEVGVVDVEEVLEEEETISNMAVTTAVVRLPSSSKVQQVNPMVRVRQHLRQAIISPMRRALPNHEQIIDEYQHSSIIMQSGFHERS
jgi:hypothetical protein